MKKKNLFRRGWQQQQQRRLPPESPNQQQHEEIRIEGKVGKSRALGSKCERFFFFGAVLLSSCWFLLGYLTLNEKDGLFLSHVLSSPPLSLTSSAPLETQSKIIAPPRKMSASDNPIYFVHIGKTGGSSVDILMLRLLKEKGRKYVGKKHFDWSWVLERGDPDKDVDVITFLRHPVSRAVSQFHFSKTLKWARKRNSTFLHQTLDEYIANPGDFRQPIHDGSGGIDFLSGTTKGGGYIANDGLKTERKEYLRNHMAENALEAARNLDKTVFFGLMEDIPRSMAMLQMTLGLDEEPKLPMRNVNKKVNEKEKNISNETASKIESYIPGDLWLYEYAKRLFEARWDYFTKEILVENDGETAPYVHPELPEMSEALKGFNS